MAINFSYKGKYHSQSKTLHTQILERATDKFGLDGKRSKFTLDDVRENKDFSDKNIYPIPTSKEKDASAVDSSFREKRASKKLHYFLTNRSTGKMLGPFRSANTSQNQSVDFAELPSRELFQKDFTTHNASKESQNPGVSTLTGNTPLEPSQWSRERLLREYLQLKQQYKRLEDLNDILTKSRFEIIQEWRSSPKSLGSKQITLCCCKKRPHPPSMTTQVPL